MTQETDVGPRAGSERRQPGDCCADGCPRRPSARELPSGSVIVTFRVTVARTRTAMTSGSRQTVDWLDCTAWGAGVRRTVGSWRLGDEVEVVGALRRRFYRAGQGTSTRLEVEVLRAKRLSRRASS